MFRSGTLALVVAALAAATLAYPVSASDFKLHPSGFGMNSYCSWKGGEGLPDNTGSKNQALYFQKMTSTSTFAAGVAVFKGFEGMMVSDLTALEFKRGLDGWCGAGAPRFNLRVDPDGMGPLPPVTYFIGCQSMLASGLSSAPNGRMFETRTATAPFPSAFPGPPPPNGTIVSLAIVFDEGNDVGQGFVYLDDIRVGTNAGDHTWKSASDNGSNPESTADAANIATLQLLLGEPVTVLFP
jgi:hypothetical protein